MKLQTVAIAFASLVSDPAWANLDLAALSDANAATLTSWILAGTQS